MTAVELLANLEARGVRVSERAGALAVSPAGLLQDAEREALRANKAEVLAVLRERHVRAARDLEGLAGGSLYRLTHVLEVSVPWSPKTLFIVPGPAHVAQLEAEGIARGRVWDTAELLDMILTGVTPEDARKVASVKLTMGGHVAGARNRRP